MKTLIFAVLLCLAPFAAAQALDPPKGQVVLTVTGQIRNMNAPDAAQFDRDMLAALASRTATMETPWTEGKVTFQGPLLSAVLEAVGAQGTRLTLRALNDYAAEVPVSDAQMPTILATHQNAKPMSVREKGPVMLVYPFDLDASLYNEKYFARSVWQIREIEVSR